MAVLGQGHRVERARGSVATAVGQAGRLGSKVGAV